MKQRKWVEYESRAASLLPSGGIVMLRLGVIYLQSVLLQVLLEPGPRMTHQVHSVWGGGSVENAQVSRVCS